MPSAFSGIGSRAAAAKLEVLIGGNALLGRFPPWRSRPAVVEHQTGQLIGRIPGIRGDAGIPVPKLLSEAPFTRAGHSAPF
jgi:hypothetical protein